MTRFRVLVAAGLATALTIGTLAVPAAAASKGRVIVVNGHNGKQAELCLGNKEIRSTFKFGQYAVVKKSPGKKLFRLRKKSAGQCQGKLLAKKWVNLQAGHDRTLVFSKKNPKATLFPDFIYGGSDLVLRNGSDVGTMEFRAVDADDQYTAWFKAAISIYEYDKGEWAHGVGWNNGQYMFAAWLLATNKIVGQPFVPTTVPLGYRQEAVMVGTGPWNARWVRAVVKNL